MIWCSLLRVHQIFYLCNKMSRYKEEKTISVELDYLPWEWGSFPVGLYRKDTDDPISGIQASFERMARLIPSVKKSTKALVFNSGYGVAAIYLADKYGCKVDCICNSEENAAATAKLVEKYELGEKITITTSKFDQVTYSGASFDLVWSMDSLSYNNDKTKTLKEVARLLVPEGRFIFTDFTKASNVIDKLWVKVESAIEEREMLTSDEYIKLADKADLERVYIKEDPEHLAKHLDYIVQSLEKQIKKATKAIKADGVKELKSTLTALKQKVDDKQLSWGVYQFQKRND